MIDKSLVKQRFSKSLKTYNDNAIVQKKMAKRLLELLPRTKYNSILEIGSATGILTEKISKTLEFNNFSANDIVEQSKEYIDKIIPENTFIPGDIEEITLNQKYDLIISNASLQWCENIDKTITKLKNSLNQNGVLAFSIFDDDNLKELKTILNIKNTAKPSLKGIKEIHTLYFNTPLDVLKHIKSTGVNALTKHKFTKSTLKDFEQRYIDLFNNNGKVTLTYCPLYIVENL